MEKMLVPFLVRFNHNHGLNVISYSLLRFIQNNSDLASLGISFIGLIFTFTILKKKVGRKYNRLKLRQRSIRLKNQLKLRQNYRIRKFFNTFCRL